MMMMMVVVVMMRMVKLFLHCLQARAGYGSRRNKATRMRRAHYGMPDTDSSNT